MKYKKRQVEVEAFPVQACEIWIKTPEKELKAKDGDWILKSPGGEIDVVNNDIFVKNYEAIPDAR